MGIDLSALFRPEWAVRVADDDSLCSILGICPDGVCEHRERVIVVGVDLTVRTLSHMLPGGKAVMTLFGDTGVNILARESKRKWVY